MLSVVRIHAIWCANQAVYSVHWHSLRWIS